MHADVGSNNDSASELCDFSVKELKDLVSNPDRSQGNPSCHSRQPSSSGKRNPHLPLRKLHTTPRPKPNVKTPTMSPIRIGIIGLSATSSWAVHAHLPNLKDSTKFQLTGVCNSSLESSQAAIKAHALDAKITKPYASVADLASSPDIDLIVCAVRVDRHYECLKVVLEKGKDVFVEWPLASNLSQATELLQLAEEKGVRTMVGLQGQMSPVIQRVKALIHGENSIGRVVSSSINLSTGLGGAEIQEGHEYLNDAASGGNMLVIPFGHIYDSASYVLGELREVSATLSTQFSDVKVKAAADGAVVRTIKRTTADCVTMAGLLESGAQSSAVVHGAGPLKGEPGLVWRIEGEKGIVEVRGETAFAVSMSGDVKIWLHEFASGEVKEIEFVEDRPGPPGNIGRLYDAFADGQYYPDWKWAVKRHAWVDALQRSHESGKRVSYT
jgi:predicted dehydrogenase